MERTEIITLYARVFQWALLDLKKKSLMMAC